MLYVYMTSSKLAVQFHHSSLQSVEADSELYLFIFYLFWTYKK